MIIITPPPRPYQAPKRYIREDPDFATHLEPALKELHFPKGEDAPAKLVKILECFSLEMLCALSQLPVERQPSATNLWRIFEVRMHQPFPRCRSHVLPARPGMRR